MALLTRLQARTLIQELIDDTAAKLWTAPNLDILTEATLDELWGELLDQFAWLRSTESGALTPVAPGTINLTTALTRFYRVQVNSATTSGRRICARSPWPERQAYLRSSAPGPPRAPPLAKTGPHLAPI